MTRKIAPAPDYADQIAARIDNADRYARRAVEYVVTREDFLSVLSQAAREGYALGYAAGGGR